MTNVPIAFFRHDSKARIILFNGTGLEYFWPLKNQFNQKLSAFYFDRKLIWALKMNTPALPDQFYTHFPL